MSHRRPAAVQGWTILSVSVRTRDGPDRLDHAYRRLCHSAADHQTGGEEPCAPPPTPGLFNRALDVKSWLASSLEARAVLCRARGCFRGLTRGQPHDGLRDGIPLCLFIAVRDGRGGRSVVIPTSSRQGRQLRLRRRDAPAAAAQAAATTASVLNGSPLAHIACRTTASILATATTARLCPSLAFRPRPQRLSAVSGRERVSTAFAAS